MRRGRECRACLLAWPEGDTWHVCAPCKHASVLHAHTAGEGAGATRELQQEQALHTGKTGAQRAPVWVSVRARVPRAVPSLGPSPLVCADTHVRVASGEENV